MATSRICAIEGCGNKHSSRGWCWKHYSRWRKHGDPMYADPGGRTGHRPPAKDGLRVCNKCEKSLPVTPEFFTRRKSMSLGLAHTCRACEKILYHTQTYNRHAWMHKTDEQKEQHLKVARKYSRTPRGRACHLRKAYQRIDACDLTTDEIFELISLPCAYCGTTVDNRGLDRIDNSLPHIRGNVNPACTACNVARGDKFTVPEMMIIGAAIRQVRAARADGGAVRSKGHWGPRASKFLAD